MAVSYDSAYLAYLRRLKEQEAQANRRTSFLVAQLGRNRRLTESDMRERGRLTRENISNAAEARGVFRSGARLRNLAKQRADEERRIAELRRRSSEQASAYYLEGLQQLADLRRQRAEQELAAAARAEQRRLLGV